MIRLVRFYRPQTIIRGLTSGRPNHILRYSLAGVSDLVRPKGPPRNRFDSLQSAEISATPFTQNRT